MYYVFQKKKGNINNDSKLTNKDFDFIHIQNKLKAPNTKYSDEIMLEEDPKELILSINELSYHISKDSNNTIFACYWINWIIEYELRCRRQKKELICQRRNVNVESKMQKNTIWIVWDVFLFYTKNDKVLEKIVKSSLNLFCIQYNYSSNKKYRELLYYMVMLINEKFEMPKKLISETEKINIILEKINNIYKQIKKK